MSDLTPEEEEKKRKKEEKKRKKEEKKREKEEKKRKEEEENKKNLKKGCFACLGCIGLFIFVWLGLSAGCYACLPGPSDCVKRCMESIDTTTTNAWDAKEHCKRNICDE